MSNFEEKIKLVKDGLADAIPLARELKAEISKLNGFFSEIEDDLRRELEALSPQDLEQRKIKYTFSGYTYNYEHIPEWVQLKAKLKELEEVHKSAINNLVVDEETGEIIQPAKAYAKKKSITFK